MTERLSVNMDIVARHHIAEKPVAAVREVDAAWRDRLDHKRTDKPQGFWYEVDGDWRRWCDGEELRDWYVGRALYRVELGDEKILRPTNLLNLTDEYAIWTDIDRRYPLCGPSGMDWARIAQDWDGIEIAPYAWEWRLKEPVSGWYYTWDCASGVIWRPRGVRVVLEIPEITDGTKSKREDQE